MYLSVVLLDIVYLTLTLTIHNLQIVYFIPTSSYPEKRVKMPAMFANFLRTRHKM